MPARRSDADGWICDSAGALVGTVLHDAAKEHWIVGPADSGDGWLIHLNEPDPRETAVRGLIGSAY